MQLVRLNPLLCLIFVVAIAAIPGCYYTQAVRGQMEVLRKREPIGDVIDNPATPPELADRLRLVQEARAFSISELGLPDNKSYQTYSDLERDYVVWNVFAAAEFSLAPKQWCYPVAGCVSYRGYFKKDAAMRKASKLKKEGFDVYLGGVAAYSTLGKFNDPVLSTMMRWSNVQLASVLFHELAHQLLYVKGDTGFNESFATAVEEFGIERFLLSRNLGDDFEAYEDRKDERRITMQIIGDARDELRILYASDFNAADKRRRKQQRLDKLSEDLRALLGTSGGDAPAWLAEPLNNARIASLTLYEGRLPELRIMLERCDENLECFYDEARRISELDEEERDEYLDSL